MRAVVDAVVFVRGLINPRSLCGRIVFDFAGAYEVLVSPETVSEYLAVLERPEIARKFREAGNRNRDTVLEIIANATFVHPSHVPAVTRDPGDDKFLAAAMTGGADYIVTEDNDLLVLSAYADIPICTAGAFLQILENNQTPGKAEQ
jgi:uncharacterized protein